MASTLQKSASSTPSPIEQVAPARVLIVEARFYEAILDGMVEGASKALTAAGATFERIAVPGALEIPAAILFAHRAGRADPRFRYDAYVALGCIIRGETYHFEVVCNESARGLQDLALQHDLAIGNGILTVDTEAQAWERARVDQLDKGGGAAEAALAMLRLKRRFAIAP